jgi:hypothetical protein
MQLLPLEYITDLYCLVDELLEKPPAAKVGRPAILTDAEVITMLLWNTLTVRQTTLKDLYRWISMYHKKEFPKLPHYNKFLESCHRAVPVLYTLLQCTLNDTTPVRLLDSTILEVCKLVRADRHKVCKNIADFGKNHQGWHYGFKLHTAVDPQGKLCALLFTQASFHDAQAMPNLLNQHTKVAVGDSHYGASVMGKIIHDLFGTIIVAPPHYKQKTKLLTGWQLKLLHLRPKIECVFDYLKNHLHLVSSFPRSIKGYVLHYLRILLGYQLLVG